MALSMDEQRMLAEIERRLAAEDPGLAARLSSFKRPGPAVKLRSPRSKIIGSLFAVAAALVLSVMIYAMIPFRAHAPKDTTNPQATGGVSASAPVKPAPKPAAKSAAAAKTAATAKSGTAAKSATAKSGAAKAATSGAASVTSQAAHTP
jgi:cytoskeletal protein RodZ